MLDEVIIFTMSGIVLWSKTLSKLQGQPVDDLITNVLIEEKGGEKKTILGNYKLEWELDKCGGRDLVYLVSLLI